ncbi:MarR family transcriptional regulator [Asanoa sp. WMMD1127]|uniref:GbsR/MarR family transcriptional regulator n=1 Tax=Asanoa sp. WMMD1127 TaxID=3016107 RepID=UPI0024178ADE|nr:MarR family transcriptional regulator [Asanoa sp. WMMD1127]MDG4825851.1 MarR family transcriptional regulator [Asanoa sp. WMMD1127]
MPGGRLTHDERVAIAAGLAEGYGYAEIARGLDRPTSTVTREVARNGGARGYTADRAHRATARRARRRPPAGPPATTAADRQAFVEEFAVILAAAGMPRMVARVLSCLYTSDDGALTAAELVERLRVSPAAVSKAVGYLAGLDLVRRERAGRRDRYVVDDDVWLRAWEGSARTHLVWAEAAERGAGVFGRDTAAGARLADLAGFFGRLGDDMSGGPSDAAVADVLTVAAALVHAGVPVRPADLAAGLGWPPARVRDAIHDAVRRPDLTGPVLIRRTRSGLYLALPRLTEAEQKALTAAVRSS